MERRIYNGSPYYGGGYQGSPYYNHQSPSSRSKSPEDDLVARSREWMSRQDNERDPWRRSVDDFLESSRSGGRYKSRDRSPRVRSRSRSMSMSLSRSRSRSRSPWGSRERDRVDRKRRTSRERAGSRGSSRERRRTSDEEEVRERTPHNKKYDRENHRWTEDRENYRRTEDRENYRRTDERENYRRTDERENYRPSQREPRYERYSQYSSRSDDEDKKCSSDDDQSNSYEKSDTDFDYANRPYSDCTLRAEERFAYKKQMPQKTVIIRGLAQHITEHDIQEDIILSQLQCKDIRLVRRKDTGTSRGFAFVEFNSIEDATKWIDSKQGELMLKDHFRALLQYSLPKDHSFRNEKWHSDWYCKCQAHNFRRRDTCFKCNLSRKDGEILEGTDEVSSHPTNTVLLRGLDALTTEESVLHSIKSLSSLPIRSVRIGRDPATNMSRGVCYIEMNSVVDAMYLHNALQTTTPVVDGRSAIISYAKLDPLTLYSSAAISGQIANAAVAAAQWSHQKTETVQYKLGDVPRLAEYSANLYATNPQEKAAYKAYYEDYYKKQINEGGSISLPVNTTAGLATAQAAVEAHKKANVNFKSQMKEAPDGSGSTTYPPPEVSSYQFDKSSGYYYDPFTTLYYDANSQYYYNNKTGKFLYWNAAKKTYLPAPTDVNSAAQSTAVQQPPLPPLPPSDESKDDEKKAKEKENEKDKVKVAKRIAKDMEKWAKTLNQKKENAKQNIVAAQQAVSSSKAAGAADIGYAVLERKDLSLPILSNGIDLKAAKNESLVAAYGQGSDSEEDTTEENSMENRNFTDWTKMACLLCKRQFPNKDTLVKHQQLSDLHKQNLAAWYKQKSDSEESRLKNIQYRDRAKERRLKYGEPDTPQPSKLKETYIKGREVAASINYEKPNDAGIAPSNLGSKLLQKMGWHEGMGLGKSNQGRTSIITAERRTATAGLGTKAVGVTPGPGETYKDCVKKMMQIRYSEIDGPNS